MNRDDKLLHGVVELVDGGGMASVSTTLFEDEEAAVDYALRLVHEQALGATEDAIVVQLQTYNEYRQDGWGVFLVDAVVEHPATRQYTITVTVIRAAGVKDKDLDDDDREQRPEGSYMFNPLASSLRAAKARALTDFHSTVPIGCLENYEIEATSLEDAIPTG